MRLFLITAFVVSVLFAWIGVSTSAAGEQTAGPRPGVYTEGTSFESLFERLKRPISPRMSQGARQLVSTSPPATKPQQQGKDKTQGSAKPAKQRQYVPAVPVPPAPDPGKIDEAQIAILPDVKFALESLKRFDPPLCGTYFRAGEFPHPRRLLKLIKDGQDPVSKYIWPQLTPDLVKLSEDPAADESKLRPLLARDLNKILDKKGFYSSDQIVSPELRKYFALRFGKGKPETLEDVVAANRLLLEAAYPSEFQPVSTDPVAVSLRRIIYAWAEQARSRIDSQTQLLRSAGAGNKKADEERLASLAALYKWPRKQIAQRNSVIDRANTIGYIICIVVHVLLVVAVFIAIIEFKQSYKTRKEASETARAAKAAAAREAGAPVDQTQLELAWQGFKISVQTSLTGVVLLAIAFAFYALYLTKVYPIEVVGG